MKNDCLDASIAVLEEQGIPYTVSHGSKHPCIEFVANGKRCRHTVPGSTSDVRSHLNNATQLKRTIREAMGCDVSSAEQEPATGFLPAVIEREIGDSAVQTCDARELHRALGIGRDFTTWAKARLAEYGFVENVDFVKCEPGPQIGGVGNRGARTDYYLALDTAKELAMVERTPAGRHVRRYFIACEKALRADAPKSEWLAALQSAQSDAADARAAAELALEAVSAMQAHIERKPVAPTLDLSQTITSDDLISMAGINPGHRVRGTSSMVTGRMLRFTAGHGCFKTPSHLNPSMPWRFPREKATEWLFGASLGCEQIRAQVARQRSRRTQRSAQGHLRLIGPSQPSSGA